MRHAFSEEPVALAEGLNSPAALRKIPFPAQLLFGAAILCGSSLLFLVQPLISRMILPWFGGSAVVWIVALLFFQTDLLLGYLYAHLLTRGAGGGKQAAIHIALLALSLAALPILPNPRWQPAPGADPTWHVFGVLAASVGLPYFLLSSATPLLQSWYAASYEGALPYGYFALSNFASLAALLAYPVLVEPHLRGKQQAWMWSFAYALFTLLYAALALFANARRKGRSAPPAWEKTRVPLGASRILLWLSLAACASTLLLVVTTLLVQDIAPMPLLWVVPLGIYLVSFIFCFDRRRWYRRVVFLPLVLPALGCIAAVAGPLSERSLALVLPLACGGLFVCCMACHGELARCKPPAAGLTAFYLSVAGGGAAGGFFVALAAPRLFSRHVEYPAALAFCGAVLLAALWPERRAWTRPKAALALWFLGLAGTAGVTAYMSHEMWKDASQTLLAVRNFYGALTVLDSTGGDNKRLIELHHGVIIHGAQFTDAGLRRAPTTYYGDGTGIDLAWRTLAPSGPLRMGVVGLGAGTLAAYGRAGDTLRFYEINPAVIQIARTQFTYLSDSPARIDVVLGDARLSLEREPSQQFDILVVDAFSGDAVPVHLLTREAFRIYWRHLKPDGVLAMHITNRFVDLAPVVLLAARESGKTAWEVDNDEDEDIEVYASTYVLVTNRPKFFDNSLFGDDELSEIDVPSHFRMWTDDYSNAWQLLRFINQ